MRFTYSTYSDDVDTVSPGARWQQRAGPQAQRRRQHNVRATTAQAGCVLTPTGTYMDAATCSTQGQCNWKYKCAGDNSCILAEDGTFTTLEDCYGAGGKCGWKWKCANGACVQDQAGTFNTQAECQSSADPTLGRCGWKWDCATVTQAQATADPAGYNYDAQGALFQVVDANRSKVKNTAAELMCISPSTSTAGPSCVCKYDPAKAGTFGTLSACAASATGRCGWKWGCASVTQAEETADPVGTSYQYQGKLMAVTESNKALLKDKKEDLKCISASTASGGPSCVCQYSATATPTFTTMDACAADATAKCGWKWDCAAVPAGTTDVTKSYEYQGALVAVTSANSAKVKNTAAELKCVSAGSSASTGAGGPSCACGYDSTKTTAAYGSIADCVANATDKCEWQYSCTDVSIVPNAKASSSETGIYYVDMKAKTKRMYPDMTVFKSWWPPGTIVVMPEIESFTNGATMAARKATDPVVADYNYERQVALMKPTTSTAANGMYKTFPGRAWYGTTQISRTTGVATLDACITEIQGNASATGGFYNSTKQECGVYSGVGALSYGLGTDTAIVKTSTVSDATKSKKCVRPSGASGPACSCGAPTSTSPALYFDTITACKADTTAQCGWKYDCNAGQEVTVQSGSATLKAADYKTYDFFNPGQVYLPIGGVFVAYKPFVEVTSSGTGSARVPDKRSDGSTATQSSDAAEFQFALVGYGNYTVDASKVDPDTSNPVVVASTVTRVLRTDTATTLPALTTATGGVGQLTVGKQYQMFVKIRDMTDDDMEVTWPSFTITQLDALPANTITLAGTSPNSYPWQLRKDSNPGSPDTFYKGENVGGATWETSNFYTADSKELLVPLTIPFKALTPNLAVRADDSGRFYVETKNYDQATGDQTTSGSDNMAARYVLLAYGNQTPGKLDNSGTELAPVFEAILWGNESAYGGRGQWTNIPGFTSSGIQSGNAFAEVGKTYRLYARIWDQTDDMFILQWPTFSVTMNDAAAAGVATTTVNNVAYPATLTSGANTPCLLFNTPYVPAAAYANTMYSLDGKTQLFRDTDGALKFKDVATGKVQNSVIPANSANTHLCMQDDGNLVMYPEQGAAALYASNSTGSTKKPFSLKIQDMNGYKYLEITQSQGAPLWPSMTFTIPAGSAAMPRAGYPYCWGTKDAALQYAPVGDAFVAYKPYVTVSGSQVSLEIGGGEGGDAAGMEVVLVPYGNVTPGQMDPNTTGSKKCQTMDTYVYMQGLGCGKSGNANLCYTDPTNPMPVGGEVYFFSGHKRNYNTNSGQGTPLNGKKAVTVGKTYRVYMRILNATDDQVTAYWNNITITMTDT